MADKNLAKAVEAILFVAGEPVSLKQLTEATSSQAEAVQAAIKELEVALTGRGVRLTQNKQNYLLVTIPEAKTAVEKFLGAKVRNDLTKPALETLAIIAYKQPITKSQIEAIRGVASDQTIKNLLIRGLVVEAGTANQPGRPVLYETSMKFLQLLGISRIQDIPPFKSDQEFNAS